MFTVVFYATLFAIESACNGECIFYSNFTANVRLDLRTFQQSVIKGNDSNPALSYQYEYSPCRNGLKYYDPKESVMAKQMDKNGIDTRVLAYWNDGLVKPIYNKLSGMWTFKFQYGEPPVPSSNLYVYFYCNPNVNNYHLTEAHQISDDLFEMKIETKCACQGQSCASTSSFLAKWEWFIIGGVMFVVIIIFLLVFRKVLVYKFSKKNSKKGSNNYQQVCTSCNGSGTIQTRCVQCNCNGDGYIYEEVSCSNYLCNYGRINSIITVKKQCIKCLGTGQIKTCNISIPKSCKSCNGKGEYAEKTEKRIACNQCVNGKKKIRKQCNACYGRKYNVQTNTCTKCNGTGTNTK